MRPKADSGDAALLFEVEPIVHPKGLDAYEQAIWVEIVSGGIRQVTFLGFRGQDPMFGRCITV